MLIRIYYVPTMERISLVLIVSSHVILAVTGKEQLDKIPLLYENTQHIAAQVLLSVHRREFNPFNCSFYFFLLLPTH